MPVILVVDDDAANRSLACALLTPYYTVREAIDGPAALWAVTQGGIDLVLLDAMMPGMTGFDVCRQLKRDEGPFLPVLMVTALSDQVHRNAGLEAGADDFIAKPFDGRELRLRVATFLRLRRQDEEIRAQISRLRDLDALKDDLVSLVLHDLRNPLAAAVAVLDALEPEAAATLSAELDVVRRQHLRMTELIEDILTARQLEDGAFLLQAAEVDVAAPVRAAVDTVTALARSRGVALELEAVGSATLSIDTGLVRRAVENLLTNAVRHTPAGEAVSIVVNGGHGFGEIVVADRGGGLPPAARKHLFEKYGARARRHAGSHGFGLGLYLVRLVADAHGGRAWATDRAGGGTAFTIRLGGGPR